VSLDRISLRVRQHAAPRRLVGLVDDARVVSTPPQTTHATTQKRQSSLKALLVPSRLPRCLRGIGGGVLPAAAHVQGAGLGYPIAAVAHAGPVGGRLFAEPPADALGLEEEGMDDR
jgi:hypothetical protein